MHADLATPPAPPPAPATATAGQAFWNPATSACWSLLLTPAFGAFLVMCNWAALGDQRQARLARRWCLAAIAVLVLNTIVDAFKRRMNVETNCVDWSTLGFALAWYGGPARAQGRLLRARYGADYRRQRWDAALKLALLTVVFAALARAGFIAAFVALT